jgi:F-type H+-transporting ATPase subunit gamma
MDTINRLQQKISTTAALQSVVKTMKALAASNIHQCEQAVTSLAAYQRTVEMGLQVVLHLPSAESVSAKPAPRKHLGAIVFGSDQGLCGQLNEQIATYACHSLAELTGLTGLADFAGLAGPGVPAPERSILVVGTRVAGQLSDAGQYVDESLPIPSSTAGITVLVQELLVKIQTWQAQSGRSQIDQVVLFYNQFVSGAVYRPCMVHLLPVDQAWLHRLGQQPWPTRMLPLFSMDRDQLFSALIRQYLFVSLFRACAESLASENASRLAAMQGAERNIEERLEELQTQFHQQRQMTITEELLDIVAGFEALSGK